MSEASCVGSIDGKLHANTALDGIDSFIRKGLSWKTVGDLPRTAASLIQPLTPRSSNYTYYFSIQAPICKLCFLF